MEPILTTKLHIPAVHPNGISRPHLLNKLDENLWQVPDECFLRRLTLIAAPAGYGKSTLLGEWTRHLKIPVAWITFDEADNNPRRFYRYVVSALQTVQPGLGEEDIAAFHSPQPAVSNEVITSVMTSLIDEIAHVAQPFLLVFDDYHTIQTPGIHLAVKLLLDQLPENLSLVIATRADPPLPLSRLRARRQMIEVRSGDLRFSESEADLFLRKVMQLDLQNPDILTLTERTEGWIAGLQMAALALQGCVDPVDFIRNFNGRERFVIDYLFEEVLSRQPEGLQTFLVRTSILEHMTGPLCDAVMGNQEARNDASLPTTSIQWTSQQTLEYLERANLFLVPLDNERLYYRYHHLFSDLLKHRLFCSSPDLLPQLHARAAEWFEQEGQAQEAFDHWIAAKDYQRASNIVKKNGYQLIALGNFHQLLAWLEQIPESLVYSQSWLCAFYGWALLFTGRYSEAERFLTSAEKTLTPLLDQADPVLLEPYGHIAAVRGYMAFHSQDEAGAIHYADLAMKYVAADDLIVKSMVSFIYCAVECKPNQYASMRDGLTEVARLGIQAGNIFIAVNTLCILAELMRMQGKLHDAFEIYREAAGRAVDNLGRVLPIIASMYVGRARLHYEWDDFQAAEADILSASKIFKWYPAFDLMAENNILLAKLRSAQGDIIAAEQLIREIKQSGKQAYYRARVALLASEITLCVAKGDLMQLAQLIDQQDWSVGDKSLSAWGDTFIARAQVFIAHNEFDRAYQLLEEYRTNFESSGLWTHALKALVVQACTLELQGEYASAEDQMQQALSIAEPEGYIRIFVDAGAPAKSLVTRCRYSIIERINSGKEVSAHILAYVDRLLSMFPSVDNEKFLKPRRKEIPCPDLIDPLTERELEVLHLIADGFSNKEIAEKLVVTVGTVKTHTSNIYRKLDVLGRTKALAKARQLNLV